MPANIEIKARIHSVDDLVERARSLSDDRHLQLIHHDDTFFPVADGRLKLRVFGDGSGELIHYQRRDADGPRRSDYVITPIAEPDGLREVLGRALGTRGRVRKHRILALVGSTRVHLDRVEGLGHFLELEVVLQPGQTDAEGQAIAQGLMEALGIGPGALVSRAYLDLLIEAGGTHPTAPGSSEQPHSLTA